MYLKTLWGNYKVWKAAQKFPESFRVLNRWPSETYMKYPPYSNFGGKKVLNFGCGTSVFPSPNVVNADVVPGPNISVIDPSKSLAQFGTDFDLIIANHVLEHVPNWFETMKEMATILKVGGTIEIWIPPVSSDSSFTYRDHINRIGFESFAGCATLRRSGANALAAEEFKTVGDFAKLRCVGHSYRTYLNWWILISPEFVVRWMVAHLRNVISEEGFFFVKGE